LQEPAIAAILNSAFAPRVSVHIFGLGALVLGVTGLIWGAHSALGEGVVVMSLLAGLAMQWQRTALPGAVVFFVAYCLAIMFFHVPRGFAHRSEYVAWYGVFENLALAAAALIIGTHYARLAPATVDRLRKISAIAFGICAIYFGLSHHFYLAFTVSLVPAWLPPGQTFWAYATAAGHIAAGIAIIFGVYARPAAMLLAAMFIVFAVLVHVPRVILNPHKAMSWAENAINFALTGAAWVIAASIPAARTYKAARK
jgi:uncharacterized membrane protein YphA (DoxX/SURF4 family)